IQVMDGGELFFQVVRLGFFSEELCRHIMLQVAGGVMYLHDTLGIMHGDIKTENLLFRRIPYYDNCDDQSASYTRNPSRGLFLPGIGGGGVELLKSPTLEQNVVSSGIGKQPSSRDGDLLCTRKAGG
ncbi:hypothetical protein R3P38DRAFT_2575558, partial [Favolaschia claudopus]